MFWNKKWEYLSPAGTRGVLGSNVLFLKNLIFKMSAAKKEFGIGNLQFWFLILFLFGDKLPLRLSSLRQAQ